MSFYPNNSNKHNNNPNHNNFSSESHQQRRHYSYQMKLNSYHTRFNNHSSNNRPNYHNHKYYSQQRHNNHNTKESSKSFPNNYHNYNNQHKQHNSHNQHHIISEHSETLIFEKKKAQAPLFYDQETQLAKQCQNIEHTFDSSIFESGEKEKLINTKCSLIIKDYHSNIENNKNANVDCNGHPVTPTGSDDEESDIDNDKINNEQQLQYPNFGPMKDTQFADIRDQTNNFRMINKDNGMNMLMNDNNEQEGYHIYTENRIVDQVMMVPNGIMMDGNDLINNAKVKYISPKTKMKGKSKVSPERRNKKIRRGKKVKNENGKLNKQVLDQLEANKLANYLRMIRNQKC